MYRCIICAFGVELDDTVVVAQNGRCICLRCFARETGSQKLMRKQLRQEVVETLATVQ